MNIKNLILTISAAQVARSAILKANDEDLATDLSNASLVSASVQSLTNSITVTDSACKTADSVIAAIEQCVTQDPVFAVLGFVSSMTKLFV